MLIGRNSKLLVDGGTDMRVRPAVHIKMSVAVYQRYIYYMSQHSAAEPTYHGGRYVGVVMNIYHMSDSCNLLLKALRASCSGPVCQG